MTEKEFEEKYLDGNSVNLPFSAMVYRGADEVEHKNVYRDTVYQCDEQFFQVTTCRSNSGYWSDSEYDPPVVCEVFPYEFTETRYKIRID